MDSIVIPDFRAGLSFPGVVSAVHACGLPCVSRIPRVSSRSSSTMPAVSLQRSRSIDFRMPGSIHVAANGTTNSVPLQDVVYTVGDFMTNKDNLHVVRTTTTVDEALECLVYKRVTGFPVIDDDWRLVGVVSDYDLLALDSISGGGQNDINIFPVVNSTWKAFNELQRLLSKTNGKVVGDLMTPAPLVVRENTNLEDAARLLLQTKYRRLPVVDGEGRLIGIITRGDVIKAALQIKQDAEKWTKMP